LLVLGTNLDDKQTSIRKRIHKISMKKAIIFDSDDTIFHSNKLGLITLKEICKKNNVPFSKKKYLGMTGKSRSDKARILFGDKNKIWAEWNKAYEDGYQDAATDLPGAINTLKKLKEKGIILFIFSTKKSNLIKQALNKYKVKDLFSEIIGGDSIPKKPNVFLFEQILKQYSLEKEEVLLVGDSKVDSLAALHLFVDFTQIAYFEQEPLPLANKVITSLNELIGELNL